jgi:hypothetical protein
LHIGEWRMERLTIVLLQFLLHLMIWEDRMDPLPLSCMTHSILHCFGGDDRPRDPYVKWRSYTWPWAPPSYRWRCQGRALFYTGIVVSHGRCSTTSTWVVVIASTRATVIPTTGTQGVFHGWAIPNPSWSPIDLHCIAFKCYRASRIFVGGGPCGALSRTAISSMTSHYNTPCYGIID